MTNSCMTHGLKGVLSFLQIFLALALQDRGFMVYGIETGTTAWHRRRTRKQI